MTIKVAEVHAKVQRLVSVVKMASVLECATEELRSVVRFMWAKWRNEKDIYKEIFPVYGGKCLSRKAFPHYWQMFRWSRRCWNGVAEVTETTVKSLLCCGFRRTGKAMGQVYQCWWKICREKEMFFSSFEYYIFTFYIHLCPIYCLSIVTPLDDGPFLPNPFTIHHSSDMLTFDTI
jgi:hypothetical protein